METGMVWYMAGGFLRFAKPPPPNVNAFKEPIMGHT